jgi:V/A-type H+-transporting ATPase subunit I
MRSPEHALPARMARVAIVAPRARLREALAAVAEAGCVELSGPLPPPGGEELEALRRLGHNGAGPETEPRLAAVRSDPAELERHGARDLLAGEVELVRRAEAAVKRGSFAALVGWVPETELAALQSRLAPAGSAAIELPRPPWVEPPTLLVPVRAARPFRPLVETYGPARYADIDPTLFAGIAFVLMFGMMFGDLGHGLLLVLAGLGLRRVRRGRLLHFRALWPLLFAGGLAGAAFGLLYGEAFGPTGLIPTIWLDPVEEPIPLLAAALGVGALLLAVSYGFGTINRWRESGATAALLASSGVAGSCVFLGGVLAALGWYVGLTGVAVAGAVVAAVGVALLATGFALEAGRGATGITQAGIEVVDAVVRTGANLISFTRLAAFGLMHAALGAIIFAAAGALWGGPAGAVLAVAVFVAGNLLAFGVELLVAGVQALRLEYYELFSRVFAGEGRRFEPWSIPPASAKEEP